MTKFLGKEYIKSVEAGRLSYVTSGDDGQYEALKKALLDWANSNVHEFQEQDRKRAYYNILAEQGLEFATVKRNGHTFFAIKLTRPVSTDGSNNVIATTEVVLRGGEGKIAVEVNKTYRRRSHARDNLDALIKPPTILGVLAKILSFRVDEKDLKPIPKITSDKLPDETVAEAKRVIGLMTSGTRAIKNPVQRQLPVVVALEPKEKKKAWRERVDGISKDLFGFAHVVIIPEEQAAAWNDRFPTSGKWELKDGDIRLFKPTYKSTDETTKHPLLTLAATDEEVGGFVRTALKDSLTPDLPAEELPARLPSFKELYDDAVSITNAIDDRSKPTESVRILEDEIKILRERLADAEGYAEIQEAEETALRGKLAEATQRLAELERQNTDLAARVKASDKEVERLKAEVAALKPNAAWTIAAFVATEPLTEQVKNVTEWAAKHFPDSLVIMQQFQDNCNKRQYSRYEKTEKLYQALSIIGIYYSDNPKWKTLLDKEENKTEKEKWYTAEGVKRPIIEVMEKHSLEWGFSGDNNVNGFNEYQPVLGNVKIPLTMHVKDNYAGSNDLRMFRVYYGTAQRPEGKTAAYVGGGPHHLPTKTGF